MKYFLKKIWRVSNVLNDKYQTKQHKTEQHKFWSVYDFMCKRN